jgi:hypothetical protein
LPNRLVVLGIEEAVKSQSKSLGEEDMEPTTCLERAKGKLTTIVFGFSTIRTSNPGASKWQA